MDGVFFDKNLIQYSLIGYTPDCCFQSNQKNEVILCANRALHLFLHWVPKVANVSTFGNCVDMS